MKNLMLVLFCFNLMICHGNNKKDRTKELEKQLNKQGVSFTENKGQVVDQNYHARPDVLFGGQNKGLTFHLRNNGISYQLYRVDKWKDVPSLTLSKGDKTAQTDKVIDQQTIYRIDVNWLNANTQALIKKEQALDGVSHFYTEGCPEGGALNVRSYKEVTYQNLYNGIDLKWYEKNGELKYDYLCSAGTDYKQIQLEIKGAEQLSINRKGELVIKTPLGIILEKAPLVLQQGRVLKSHWVLKNTTLSFDIQNLNPNIPYVIDPAVRLWGTYYGGPGYDEGKSSTTDGFGNVYIMGQTYSSAGTAIATAGSHQTTYGGGTADAFLVKFDGAGLRLWGTYYGGTGNDRPFSCGTDASGNIYLAGISQSSTGTVIATAGSHQSKHGGDYDAFLVKFNGAGVRLWGTYYGGTGYEMGCECSTDAMGNVYLAGVTSSNTSTVIATAGSHQSTNGGGYRDAFLVKFDGAGVRLWGTYYGGTGIDNGYSCSTDAFGNVYLMGDTESSTGTVIATAGSHQSTVGGGSRDAYLVKLDGTGVRLWGTYYGGTGDEDVSTCITDASANVYLAGCTNSSAGTVIATAGSHQSAYGGGNYDAFLVKFNDTGARLWGTYYGGAGIDRAFSCSNDASGNVYLVGHTDSNTGTAIATAGSHQSAFGGTYDAFLVKFNDTGVRQWGTYYGGSGTDIGNSCSTNTTGTVYLAGTTDSNTGTVIATVGSHQSAVDGANDAFLVKFMTCDVVLNPTAVVNATVCTGSSINFTTTITGTATPTYSWRGPNTFTSSVQNPSLVATGTINVGIYTLTVNNAGCVETATAQISAVVICTGIDEKINNLSLIEIYPNPANDVLNINLGSLDLTTVKIEVMNSIGQIVLLSDAKSNLVKLNLSQLESGMYMVKVALNSKESISQKLIKN